jgi:hypothetical protein
MARKTDTFLSQSQELDPARKDKLEAEEIEASAKLKLAQGKLEGNGKGAAGTKEEADKLLDAMKAGSGEEATAEKKRRVGEGSSSAVDAEMVDADAAAVPETAEAIEAAATAAAAEAAEAARAKASSEKCDGTRPTGVYSLVAVLTHKGRSSDSGHCTYVRLSQIPASLFAHTRPAKGLLPLPIVQSNY